MTTPVQNLTYTSLSEQLPGYMERTDDTFVAQVPTLIMLAENRIATDLKQQGFQSVVSGVLPLDGVLAKPAFWRETISFTFKNALNEYTPLYLRPLEYIRNYWPDASAQDEPRFYGDYNISNFILGPTPVAAYAFELVYYARLQPLSAENESNWMTLNIPQALLAASLLEAALWMQDDGQAAKWQGQYDAHKASILGENSERLADRTTLVTRP